MYRESNRRGQRAGKALCFGDVKCLIEIRSTRFADVVAFWTAGNGAEWFMSQYTHAYRYRTGTRIRIRTCHSVTVNSKLQK